MSDSAGADVKASVRSHVTRARLEVEVEGQPHEIGQVFDSVLASVAKHFPGATVEFSGAAVSQDTGADSVEEVSTFATPQPKCG